MSTLTAAQTSVGAGVLRPDAARHRQTGPRRGELAREPLDRLGRRDPVSCAAIAGVYERERGRETGAVVAPLARRARCAIASASAASEPGLIGSHSSALRPVRSRRGRGVDELGDIAVREAVRLGEPALVLDRRAPALQEVGAEGDDVLRLAEVVRRDLVEAEDLAVGGAHRLVIEALVAHQPAAERRRPLGQQIGEGARAPRR